ncbi:hypothetical protein F441_01582 [Phytophthora nicotianae CJ01A1]|nr:hypothetical protein F441_01582 [Phytophthora nicotianae CJ01A1]
MRGDSMGTGDVNNGGEERVYSFSRIANGKKKYIKFIVLRTFLWGERECVMPMEFASRLEGRNNRVVGL